MTRSGESCYTPAELESFRNRGVVIPAPHLVAVGREITPEAIAAGAELHPFCRLGGAVTRVDESAVIGRAGPATVEDSWVGAGAVVGSLGPVTLRGTVLGPGTVLGCGTAEQAVFLGKETDDPDFSTGYGFRVRKGSLYEEDANSAQHTDTKMTILFPWVTLGSNINWCDILVAGGTGPKVGQFTEIGSGAIHFNFTPRGDKATGSLLGNVVDGVFLRSERLFIGGNASVVGPLRARFGALTGAGGRYQRELQPGMNPPAPPLQEATAASSPLEVYGSVHRVYRDQVHMVGELRALAAWYAQARAVLARGDSPRQELYARARAVVDQNIAERIAQLGALAARMERSARLIEAERSGDPRIGQQRALLEHWPRIQEHLSASAGKASEAPASFLEALEKSAAEAGGVYTRAVQGLPQGALEEGRAWLQGIVQAVATEEVLGRVPAIARG